MNKILVTTDLSSNSKAGIRFAIQLALQSSCELCFIHVYNIPKLASWDDAFFIEYEKKETFKLQKKLNEFVQDIYKKLEIKSKNINCVLKSSVLTDSCIREYARDNKYDYICISTRGAGAVKKYFGTNTSNLITHSTIPVIAVPHNYKRAKIKRVTYASDFSNLENELKRVIEFTNPINAKVEVLHFHYPTEISYNNNLVKEAVEHFTTQDIELHIEKIDPAETLITNINYQIKKSKPSMMIMFTQQNRTFFDKLFLSSKSAEYSFDTKIPLLVFNKI